MTQRARKGKLYQLQYQIDLSYFIVARPPCIWLLQRFGSTKLIHFANNSHKAGGPRWNSQICQADSLPPKGTLPIAALAPGAHLPRVQVPGSAGERPRRGFGEGLG